MGKCSYRQVGQNLSGSKLSENCPMSRPNFAQYIGNTYIRYGVLIKKACNTFQECVYHESTVYIYVICIL